ncbi:MAG: HPr family phosphocarrier protein [Lachnospiraceae bacterium]|nr:HPr family phosphocarrier protein [Lachnospiraceae bacterium]MEE3461221.1 HPr family phosphocarrier protein [Lachnospiraceae bacterium]
MKEFDYVITDEVGIHARPAGLLVKEAKSHPDTITISFNGKSAVATKLMALMQLGVKQGDQVHVSVEGASEDATAEAMEKFLKENL